MARLICSPVPERSHLRLAAAWLIAPDCFAYVESHIWPGEHRRRDAELLNLALLPGQSFLRFGEYVSGLPDNLTNSLVQLRHQQVELDAVSTYPRDALSWRHLKTGIAWSDHDMLSCSPGGHPSATVMARHLHRALDTEDEDGSV